MDGELSNLVGRIKQSREERDWMQFHNHKDMALSISLEAAELLEHFQWKNGEDVHKVAKQNKEEISDEMADIFLYLLELSDNMDVDLLAAANKKLEKNMVKYPAERFRGISTKYNRL